jgi:glycosyltransferase involved in cell wall biosynthesis
MIAHGHEVHAAGPSSDIDTSNWLKKRGVEYHTVPFDRAGLSVTRDIQTFWALRRVVGDLKPDVLLAYTIKPVIYGILVAALARIKRRYALITGLGYAFIDGDNSRKRQVVRVVAMAFYALALRFATQTFFQNRDDAELFRVKRLTPSRIQPIVVNGSGVDIDRFQATPIPTAARFLMISRLVADKGVGEFVNAARAVKRLYPHVKFDLVGPEDPNPAAISLDLVNEAVRDGVLNYHGATNNVIPFLTAASVYVLPSYREGIPRSVLEAMAMGRAVITTDTPGCRETVIDGDNGFLVPVRDADTLARTMERFIEDHELKLRMGKRSREICESKYDVRKVNAEMLHYMHLD